MKESAQKSIDTENKCNKCGGELISGYLRAGSWLAEFIPQGDEKKLKPRRTRVLCDTCTVCGRIENIRTEKPERLTLTRLK